MSNCHSLEVVGRGSETQLQVGEKLNNSLKAGSLISTAVAILICWDLTFKITYIFSYLKLWIAVERPNFKLLGM